MAIFNSGNFMSVSEPLNFSQEEQVVGSWVDGQPIYQKTVLFEGRSFATSGAGTLIPEFGSDIKKLIHVCGTTSDKTYVDFSITRGRLINSQISIYSDTSSATAANGFITALYIKEDLPE